MILSLKHHPYLILSKDHHAAMLCLTLFSAHFSAFYGMEIPYGKREFIVEEEEQPPPQPQPQPQPQQIIQPVDETKMTMAQENCHAPAHKMVVLPEGHGHVHLLVCIEWNSFDEVSSLFLLLLLGHARKS